MVNVIAWCLCGLLIGWATHRLYCRSPRSTLLVYSVGSVMGATFGGITALVFEAGPLGTLSLMSLAAAALGALLAAGLVQLMIKQLI